MTCLFCNDCEGKKTIHHYYFPRKLFSQRRYRKEKINLCEKHHRMFHKFYDRYCRGDFTNCSDCQYIEICCYYVMPYEDKKIWLKLIFLHKNMIKNT